MISKIKVIKLKRLLKQELGITKKKEYFVKWLGYPSSMNGWIPDESFKN
jgi:hypothetical protein